MASLFLVLSACEGEKAADNQAPIKVGNAEVVLIDSQGLKLENGNAGGSGKILFKETLGTTQGSMNFNLDFQLLDQGHLRLVTFSNSSLLGGVVVSFRRNSNILKVTLQAAGRETDISKSFAKFNASQRIVVNFDVHNAESPAHVLAWSSDIYEPNAANALYNSERAWDGIAPGNGVGSSWGLALNNATIYKSVVNTASVQVD
jgi:hypothetical protein